MHKKVDLRGLTPPEPVVRTKRLLAEFEDGILEVLVDAGPSKDDILHFAAFKKYQASVVAETASAVRLRIVKGNPPAEEPPPQAEKEAARPEAEPARKPPMESVLLIAGEGIGEDNRKLSASLLADVLRGIADAGRRPSKIILMNSGVTLACEGSPARAALEELAAHGAEVCVSAESLDFLGLRGRLRVGTPADAKQVADLLVSADRVIRL